MSSVLAVAGVALIITVGGAQRMIFDYACAAPADRDAFLRAVDQDSFCVDDAILRLEQSGETPQDVATAVIKSCKDSRAFWATTVAKCAGAEAASTGLARLQADDYDYAFVKVIEIRAERKGAKAPNEP